MKKLIALSFLTATLFLVGCNNDDDDISDYDQVITKNTETYWNTENPSTYYLVDEIRWIEDPNGIGNSNPNITRDFDAAILSSIETNMASLGYTKVSSIDDSNLPDLIIAAQAVATTYADVDIIWDGWYDWWGYYDPFYPGGWYPVYYEWTEGTILIEMGDATTLNEEDKEIDIVWGAGINGLVRGDQSGNINFIQDRVDEAFDQSEDYLEVK
ncbi:DUF4136 domain-containing protein [Joostella atrarenae]|uniref:DUF4136 domain-containing protein n=1 Tax=Joostella atrarenae TaxID=679257 RepID=A0ABS9J118_9FLAO|nr:DUF4136 domain-containing protein [Joostella atrarenae]MCF8714128.1 DUF4136 domain-containing protein [Joostella atrarenae]